MIIDGEWDIVTETLMGPQRELLTLKTAGDLLIGTSLGESGVVELKNGRVDGNKLTWHMELRQPFPMQLAVEAIVLGNVLDGKVNIRGLGFSPMKGTRKI